jgi:hypothetical protein
MIIDPIRYKKLRPLPAGPGSPISLHTMQLRKRRVRLPCAILGPLALSARALPTLACGNRHPGG